MTQIIPVTADHPFHLLTYRIYSSTAKMGSIDIETTVEENPWRNPPQLVSVAISYDGERAFVFDAESIQTVKSDIESKDWIMQNGLFDRLMMKTFWGIDLRLKHDTMAMQYLLDPDLPKSLEDLSERYLGLPAYKNVDYHNILNEDWNKVAAMNGEDACRTYNLLRPLADQMNADAPLSRVYQWIMMPAINELIEITQNGIPLDTERLAVITEETQKEVDTLLAELRAATPAPWKEEYPKGWPKPSWWRVTDKRDGTTGELLQAGMGRYEDTHPGGLFNPGSPNQVRHVLFDQWGLPPLEYTKDKDGDETDTPSTNADVLLMLETYHASGDTQEWLTKLREYRKATKLLSYFVAWPELTDAVGWLHPRYRPLKTATGRLASDSPNIQNVPRKKEVRECFTAPEGYTWMKADYSQIELRLAALAAGEETMLEAYRNGEDLHRLTAKLVLGDSSDSARQVGKTLNFGLLYGAGPATLQRVARSDYGVFLSLDEARAYREGFFRAYPGLAEWHQRCGFEIESSGVSRSPLGRIRYLPHAKVPISVEDMRGKKLAAIREGINHRIQSFASDILLASLIAVAPKVRPLGARVIAEVHDEIDLLVPTENVSQVAAIVRETMEDLSWLGKHGISLGVPVLASVEVGPDWGNVKEYE